MGLLMYLIDVFRICTHAVEGCLRQGVKLPRIL